jgi:hypothetical protein
MKPPDSLQILRKNIFNSNTLLPSESTSGEENRNHYCPHGGEHLVTETDNKLVSQQITV